MAKKKGNRPALDEGKKREILAIVSVGCSRRTAAKYVGCAPGTITRTARRDPAFAKALGKADTQSEIANMGNIQRAARKEQYWRAAAWALERKNPREFAPRQPDLVSFDQMKELFVEFAEAIVEDVPHARFRKSVVKRSQELLRRMRPGSRPKARQKKARP